MNVILPDLDEIEKCYDESVDYNSDDIIEIGSYFFNSLPDKISYYGWNVYFGTDWIDNIDNTCHSFITNYHDEILPLLNEGCDDCFDCYEYVICRNEELMSFVKNDASLMKELEDVFRSSSNYLMAQCDYSIFDKTKTKVSDFVTKSDSAYILGATYSYEEVYCYGYFFQLETYIILSVIDKWMRSGGKEVPEWQKISQDCLNNSLE